jgi:hypothetical protein
MAESLPRSLDVTISLSKAQTEIATDMSLMCILAPDDDFLEADRVKYYTSFTDFQADYPSNTSLYWAGKAFFERSPHPAKLAVGLVSTADTPAKIVSGASINIDLLNNVSVGSFAIDFGADVIEFTGLDFAAVTNLTEAIAVITGHENWPATATLTANDDGGITLSTGTVVGDDADVDYAEAASAGTFVGDLLKLTTAFGATLSQGHTAGDIAEEAALVLQKSKDDSSPIYGWALDASYRDTDDQQDFADWVSALESAYCMLVTNLATAYSSADETNIGYYCHNADYSNVGVIYHNNAQYYPDVSYVALMLAVDYSAANSAITAKFKQMSGIPTVPITSTQLTILNSRRINTYTLIGNNSETIREGVQSSDDWFSDDIVNLDNFVEELQVEVYNVFLRNRKVPYTSAGQLLIVSACEKICRKYVNNGVFADRPVESTENESGVSILPAYDIVPTPIEQATTSNRAARIAPPVQIIAYLAGAFHKLNINVDVIA